MAALALARAAAAQEVVRAEDADVDGDGVVDCVALVLSCGQLVLDDDDAPTCPGGDIAVGRFELRVEDGASGATSATDFSAAADLLPEAGIHRARGAAPPFGFRDLRGTGRALDLTLQWPENCSNAFVSVFVVGRDGRGTLATLVTPDFGPTSAVSAYEIEPIPGGMLLHAWANCCEDDDRGRWTRACLWDEARGLFACTDTWHDPDGSLVARCRSCALDPPPAPCRSLQVPAGQASRSRSSWRRPPNRSRLGCA